MRLNALPEISTAIGPPRLPCRESQQLCQRDRRPILTNPSSPSADQRPSAIPLALLVPLAVVELRASALSVDDGHENGIGDGGDDDDVVAVVVVIVVGDGVAVVAVAVAAVIVVVVEPHPPQDMKYIPVDQAQNEGSQTEELVHDSLYSRTI